LIHDEDQKLNNSKREEIVPRYRFASPPYYQEDHEKKKFERKTQNFELPIHYMVEQEATNQGIKMSRRVEPILVIKQETIVLPKAKPIVVEGVPVVVKMKYSEHRFNQ
jgi:hypothetical protein